MVTTIGTDEIVMPSDLVAVLTGMLVSLTWTLKLKAPVVIGVPLIAPLVALTVKPGGRAPLATDQV
jgi:hypothetical protein